MVSIISNLTHKGQASPKRNQRSQSQFNMLQKSISEALQHWNYDELMMAQQDGNKSSVGGGTTGAIRQPAKPSNTLKNQMTLAAFVKSPSSN